MGSHKCLSLASMGILLTLSFTAHSPAAQPSGERDWPNKPIRWIVPVGPGAFDTLSRLIAPHVGKNLGAPIAVENIPGPDGWNAIFRAKPDGYTMGAGQVLGQFTEAMAIDLPYKIDQFTFIGRINADHAVLSFGKHSGIKSIGDLKRASKTIRFATVGSATSSFIQMAVLMEKLRKPVGYVNFKSFSETVVGTVRGDADSVIMGYFTVRDLIAKGDLYPVLVFTEEKTHPLAAQKVPSVREAGMPEFEPLVLDRTIVGPPGLPVAIQAKFCKAFRDAMDSGELKANMEKAGMTTNYACDPGYAKFILSAKKAVDDFRSILVPAIRK